VQVVFADLEDLLQHEGLALYAAELDLRPSPSR
jgi:hypothetical protein